MVTTKNPLAKSLVIVCSLMLLIVVGCQTNPSKSSQSTEPGATKNAESDAKSNEKEVAQKTENLPIKIPAGTRIYTRLLNTVSTKESRSGDQFSATIDKPIEVNGRVVVPRLTVVKGIVTTAHKSGRLKGRSVLSLQLTELVLKDGRTFPLSTNTVSQVGKSNKNRNLALMGGGAGAGAAIGAIAGGTKGLLIGAPVGLGAGMATKAAIGGHEVTLPAETAVTFKLSQAVTIG